MEKEILNREVVTELTKVKGECRGVNLRNDAEFVLKVKGKEGLVRVEKELEEVGCPIVYGKIRIFGFYPVGWRIISLLAIKKVFNWKDKDIRELGRFATATSLVIRVYMKFFHSVHAMVKKAPRIWDEYFTIGSLAIPSYDVEKKYAIIEIRDFNLHPIFCRTMEGYFENIVKMIVKAKEVRCRETKCTFKDQGYHQFEVIWK